MANTSKPTTYIEFHILQSFPVCNLNRDDLGSPKTAVIGGVTRARVSSQCFKRNVRCTLRDMGVNTALRSRRFGEKLGTMLAERNSSVMPEVIAQCVETFTKALKLDLTFFTPAEYEMICSYIEKTGFDPKKISEKEVAKQKWVKDLHTATGEHSGLDIALFGRMIATISTMNVEAACAFSHAVTTHAIASGIDYYTALDDETMQAGYLDTQGFTAGVFYRYIVLNVDRLVENLGLTPEELEAAIRTFTEALYFAVPAGKQNGMSAKNFWDYAHVLVRTGQPVQANFDKPVSATEASGWLEPSIKRLEENLTRSENLSGNFYGKKHEFIFGDSTSLPIDRFAEALGKVVAQSMKE